jgi:hypothetical protein
VEKTSKWIVERCNWVSNRAKPKALGDKVGFNGSVLNKVSEI